MQYHVVVDHIVFYVIHSQVRYDTSTTSTEGVPPGVASAKL